MKLLNITILVVAFVACSLTANANVVILNIEYIFQPTQDVTIFDCDTLLVVNTMGFTNAFYGDTLSNGNIDHNAYVSADTVIGDWSNFTSYFYGFESQTLLFIGHQTSNLYFNVTILPCATSIEDPLILTQINIFPNPVQSRLVVEALETLNKVEVYDISGKTIWIDFPNRSSIELNTDMYPMGSYYIRIETEGGFHDSLKFIKVGQ